MSLACVPLLALWKLTDRKKLVTDPAKAQFGTAVSFDGFTTFRSFGLTKPDSSISASEDDELLAVEVEDASDMLGVFFASGRFL